jgi:hypothetical protein
MKLIMKETEVINKIKNNLKEIFSKIEFAKILEIVSCPIIKSSGTGRPDLLAKIQIKNGSKYLLIFEVKTAGQPRYARMAISQLKDYLLGTNNSYGIFVSTFISEESRKICQKNGIGFMDLAGNCFLSFDNIFLNIEGLPNPFPDTRPLKTIFCSKSSRALRVMLCNPKKEWFVKYLAKEADISIGQASLLKNKLLENELIEELQVNNRVKFRLLNPERLLNEWAENYDYKNNEINNYYSLEDIETVEKKISDYCNSKKSIYAFTLTSGASKVAPFLRYNRIFFYYSDNIERISKELGFKKVTTGPNISILKPYDEGIYYGLQEIDGTSIPSDIQLYLDLITYKERGEEAAKFLLEKRIRKKW